MTKLTGFQAVCTLWNWEDDWRNSHGLGASYEFESARPLLTVTTLRNQNNQLTQHTRTKAQFSGGNFQHASTPDRAKTSLTFTYRTVAYHAYWSPSHSEPEPTRGLPKDLLLSIEFNNRIPYTPVPPVAGNRLSLLREWRILPKLDLLDTDRPIAEVLENDDDPRIRIKLKSSSQMRRIQIVDYPGKPFESGSIGEICAHQKGEPPVHKEWAFWTSGDIDLAGIFAGDDVEEVIIPDTPKWSAIFQNSPYKVTIEREN